MENRELENKISSVIYGMVPEDSFDKISERIAKGDVPERSNVKMNNGSKVKRVLFPVAAACIFLIVSVVFGLTYYGNNYAVAAVIDIDVNPSIELSINKKEKVLKVRALNDDGKEIIEGMKLKNKHVDVAVDEIVGSMVEKGYVADDEDNGILVTVKNKDHKKAEKFREKIVKDFDKALGDHDVNAPVINQSATDIKKVKEFAEENDISVGKAMFVTKLVEEDETLSAEELADMSIKEIMEMIKEKDIEIEKVAHCHRGGDKDKDGKGDKGNPKEPADENVPAKPNDSVEGEIPAKPENDADDENKPENKPQGNPEGDTDTTKPETKPMPEKDDTTKPSDKEDVKADKENKPVVSERPDVPDENVPQHNGNHRDNSNTGKRPVMQATPSVADQKAGQA
ncbi:MAG: hypothetical protein E7384_02485 [Ruminococcaceae bacterium]|nr:hypothetical protein [Oscillospiraceae bacterium]